MISNLLFLDLKNKTIPDIYLNLGHFLDHFMMLIFAKAAFDAGRMFELGYDEMIIYGTLGMIMFGAISPISSFLADKFGRIPIMIIYHFGLGLSAIFAGLSNSIFQLTFALAILGAFASIYHPVGIAMLLQRPGKIGFRMGVNGVWGNMGISFAPIITGFLIFYGNWQLSFFLPGIVCIIYGFVFIFGTKRNTETKIVDDFKTNLTNKFKPNWQITLIALTISTAAGGFIFGSMSFIIPRYFELYMIDITSNIVITGILAGIVYAIAAFAQVLVGYLIDRISPRLVLFWIGIGQIIFIYLASQFENYFLFFSMLVAMSFVFGQIPITDTILARYVPDNWRSKVLSAKFLINLSIAAAVLPLTSFMLQKGLTLQTVLSISSVISFGVLLSAILLPKQNQVEHPKVI